MHTPEGALISWLSHSDNFSLEDNAKKWITDYLKNLVYRLYLVSVVSH